MKQPSIKQQWARERNFAIGRIKGIITNLKHNAVLDSTTPQENFTISAAIAKLEDVTRLANLRMLSSWEGYLVEAEKAVNLHL